MNHERQDLSEIISASRHYLLSVAADENRAAMTSACIKLWDLNIPSSRIIVQRYLANICELWSDLMIWHSFGVLIYSYMVYLSFMFFSAAYTIWQNLFRNGYNCRNFSKLSVMNLWRISTRGLRDYSLDRITYETIFEQVSALPKCKYLEIVSLPICVLTSHTRIMNLLISSAYWSFFITCDQLISESLKIVTFFSF